MNEDLEILQFEDFIFKTLDGIEFNPKPTIFSERECISLQRDKCYLRVDYLGVEFGVIEVFTPNTHSTDSMLNMVDSIRTAFLNAEFKQCTIGTNTLSHAELDSSFARLGIGVFTV